jgi:glycosyltransferase involved in cell wall biosynthesis
MRLDVIIPTYNRHDLLPLTLNSLFAAEIPEGLEVAVTVVDNNSTDGTRQVVESFQKKFGDRIQYCFAGGTGHGYPFLTEVLWQMETITIKANYQLIHDCYLFASFSNSNQQGSKEYTMPYFIGKQNTINIGANIGF